MKKILFAGLIMIASVVCTGCVKVSYDIDINAKDKVTITESKAIKTELLNTQATDFEKKFAECFEGIAQNYRAKGYEVKEYNDFDYKGLSIIKKNVEFTNVVSAMPDGFDISNKNNYFRREVGLIYTKYKICLVPNKNKMMKVQSGNIPANLYKSSTEKPVLEFSIKIPNKALKHNADMVINDRIYKWDLTNKEEPVIFIEYKKLDLSILSGVISLILIVGAVLFVVYKNNHNDVVKGL